MKNNDPARGGGIYFSNPAFGGVLKFIIIRLVHK